MISIEGLEGAVGAMDQLVSEHVQISTKGGCFHLHGGQNRITGQEG